MGFLPIVILRYHRVWLDIDRIGGSGVIESMFPSNISTIYWQIVNQKINNRASTFVLPQKFSIQYVLCQHGKGTLKDPHKLCRYEGYQDEGEQSNFQSIGILICQVIEDQPSEVVTLLTTGKDLFANISRVVMSRHKRSESLSHCDWLTHRMIKNGVRLFAKAYNPVSACCG